MKNSRYNTFLRLALAASCLTSVQAADLLWDGTNVGGTGDGVSTYASGTWSTTNANWDQGNLAARVVWNNANLDSAIFAGTFGSGTKTVTIGSNVTVNQIQVNTGSTGANRYDIGASASQTDSAITFGGTYSSAFPAITGTTGAFVNTNFNAKITGTILGDGLVINHGTDITNTGSGRFAFTNANNNFTGNIVVKGGNFAVNFTDGGLGAATNKIVLRGGSLFAGGGGTLTRDVVVEANSGMTIAVTGSNIFSGNISGSGNLTQYIGGTPTITLSGGMSGYTGTFEVKTGTTLIQTTSTSDGTWKLTSGTLKLNTADNTHIVDGAGKSALLMNGGTLDMNGKSETLNGLSGATGTVQNQAATTTSTLTLGAGDTTAIFGGIIRNNSGTGGTLALTKTGTGAQTLGGTNSYTGATTINGGTLNLSGTMNASPVTVNNGATFQVTGIQKVLNSLTLNDGSRLIAPLVDNFNDDILVSNAITFAGGTVTIVPTFTGTPNLGTYTIAHVESGITGTATLVPDFSANGATRINGTAAINTTASPNTIELTVTSLGAALKWNNAANTGIWNLNTDANFLNGAANDVFKNLDQVTFDNSSPAGSITLVGSLNPSEVTVDSANNFTFTGSGSLTGGTSLTKSGSGTLTLANTNSYTGTTTVNNGKLTVTGSLTGSNVTIASGATLAGTGSVSGSVTVAGTVAPGASVGTLATGPVTLSGTYACDLDGATIDQLAVTGNLDLTDAILTLNTITAPTKSFYVIATYTGSLTGNFASVPAGYVVDTTEPGKVTLRTPPTAPLAGTITFETDQSYPTAPAEIAAVNANPNGAAFTGVQGWSLGGAAASVHATNSSGEYLHGQAIGCSTSSTYSGAIKNSILYTGANTITFEAPYVSGTSVGFMDDLDSDGLFDAAEAGMVFGVGGSPGRFEYRNAAFGTENFGAGFTGTAGHWYRYSITIGDSIGGSRSITMAVRDLTSSTDFDFDAGTAGIQPWTFSVTDAQFGAAPEVSDGVFVRTTASARIDNVRVTSVEPPVGTAYDTWMNGFPSLTGNNRLPGADPDQDGIKNLVEFVLNGNPTQSDASILPTSSRSGNNLIFTFNRRDDSEGLVSQKVQYSNNLSGWTDVIIGATDGSSGGATYTVQENGANPDQVTVTIPTGGNSTEFARLKVEVTTP